MIQEIEIWKPLKTNDEIFEGLYEISNFGRLKSIARQVERYTWQGTRYYSILGGKILNQRKLGRNKVLFTSFTKKDELEVIHRETVYIHRAVGIAFVKNPKPGQYDKVTHIDLSDWENNHHSNIRWADQEFLSKRNMELNPQNHDNLKKANIKSGYYKNINKFRKDRNERQN